MSDDELERVLDAVKIDYSNITIQDLFIIVCRECDFNTIFNNAKIYISEDKIRKFLISCLGESVDELI